MRIISTIRLLLFGFVILFMSTAAFAQVGIFVSFGPPALPVYEQPLCPGEGYLWTPGYWAYDPDFGDYYWVPGTWIEVPEIGFLWTPGYWAWGNQGFYWSQGYWGPQVGFYGGISYGFGYFGHGYEGGRWDHDHFYYNRAVNNVNITNIHNVYNQTVVNNTVNRVSYNGGEGGINARPTPQEEAAAHERHIPPVAVQTQHRQTASADPQLRASVNQGKPPIAATQKPGSFKGNGIVPAKEAGAPYHPPANRGTTRPTASAPGARTENATPMHAKDLPAHTPATPPSTGNPKQDQKYQQQQQKLAAQQQKEHDKLAQQQEQQHQKLAQQQQQQQQRMAPQQAGQERNQQLEQQHAAQQQASQARMQQLEQQHQQQTQQMEQRHMQQQQQQLQQRQPPPTHSEPPPKH